MHEFNFPNFIKVDWGRLTVDLDKIHRNLISFDSTDYLFDNLSADGNKGGNSIVLKLYNLDDLTDKKSFDEASPISILKLLKFPFTKGFRNKNIYKDTHRRFLNEIKALETCSADNIKNVIKIYDKGECKLDNKYYLFYTMEVAEYDLKTFIEAYHNGLKFYNKVQLCIELLDGVTQLDRAVFYHRDIKPDNIFFVGGTWKIGDLGLVAGQELEYKFDEEGRFIGPRGWASPEVMNKYLSENKGFRYHYNCEIDHQSDIFQLGKVFWYIFQFNAPIGNINFFDFNKENERVFWIIRKMLHHSKDRRFKFTSNIIPLFQKISQEDILKHF